MATSNTVPDWQSMYDRINNAWNATLTKMDQNKQTYLSQLGYETTGVPSYTSQAAAIASGASPSSNVVSNLRWSRNPYSALSSLMRAGGQEKQGIRTNAMMRGLSGGIVNSQLDQIDYATGGQRAQFVNQLTSTLGGMDRAAMDAANTYNADTQSVRDTQHNYELEQLYNQNPADPANPATPPGGTVGPPIPTGGWVQADKLMATLKARQGKNKKNLNAIYAYIRQNKGQIDPADLKMLQKMAAQYRHNIQVNQHHLGPVRPGKNLRPGTHNGNTLR